MKNKVKILVSVIIITAIGLIGCNRILNKNVNDNAKVEMYDFMQYKGSYVGDNSAVGNIISNLPISEYVSKFSLQTSNKPYGVTNYYKKNKNLDYKNVNEILEKNAVVLLSLIGNADIIKFNIDNSIQAFYKYDRAELEQKYDKNLNDLFKDNNSIKIFLYI